MDVDKIQYVEVDCFRLVASANDTKRWAHVFHGLREGLKFVQGARQAHDVKTAIMSPLPSVNVPVSRLIDGSDHLLVFEDDGRRWVAKTFCYYGRETKPSGDGTAVVPLMPGVQEVELDQQRHPPSDKLLKVLREKFPQQYGEWSVEKVLPGYSVLKMPFVDGALAAPTGLGQWLDILNIVKLLHDQGFVHGDILDRNLLFPPKLEDGTEQPALVIDFDFCKPKDSLYPLGFVFDKFTERSGLNLKRGAVAKLYPQMEQAHDLHALKVLTVRYFELDVETVETVRSIATVEGLVQKVEKTKPNLKSVHKSLHEPNATKSPHRTEGRLADIRE
jgi:serine/threonine protein kinase